MQRCVVMRGVGEEPVSNAVNYQHQKLHDEREQIRTGVFQQPVLVRLVLETLDEMFGYVDAVFAETARYLVRPVTLGRENVGLADERIQPAGQVGGLDDSQSSHHQRVLEEVGRVELCAEKQLDAEVDGSCQRVEYARYVVEANDTVGTCDPRIDAGQVGNQTEDVEDEDCKEERHDADQLDVVPEESVPRLKGGVCVGGPVTGVAPHQHETDGGGNFEADDQP